MNFKRIRKNLPDAYQEVEYIQTDGAAYINTGYVPKINDVYTVKFSEQSGTENAVVFGSRSSGTYSTSTNQVYLNLSGGVQGDEIRLYQGVNYTLLQSREVDTLIELTLSVTSDGGYDNHATQPLYLFVMNNSGTATTQSSQSLIKIYGFSVTNGSLKHSFVPCYRKSDNAIGMYDIVTDSFFVNSGTGAFIKGGNVTNNVWHDVPYYIYKTSTDTLTTLPSDIYADGQSATVGLVGNMSQTGVPTPQNPIQPQECGERTGNLFDYADTWSGTYQDVTYTPINSSSFRINGQATSGKQITKTLDMTGTYRLTITIEGTENDNGSHSVNAYVDGVRKVCTFSKNIKTSTETFTGHLTAIDTIINSTFDGNIVVKIMLTEGETQVSYEPYGYKIPISSASTTTPVYLGEVQSTRKIGKLVLTGVENWSNVGGQAPFYLSNVSNYTEISRDTPFYLSSHFVSIPYNASWSTNDMFIVSYSAGFRFKMSTIGTDLDDFKTYLAQQYAAGTPVCVWYVLAEPTTAIVNEPLRKIGDYADTVSGITIPTIAGADSFDVQTTLKPSEVSLAYTGWHDASAKEWDGSEWQ